jgi:hypothetical protein
VFVNKERETHTHTAVCVCCVCHMCVLRVRIPRTSMLRAYIPIMYSNADFMYVFHVRIPLIACTYSTYYMFVFHVLHVCIPRATAYNYSTRITYGIHTCITWNTYM